MQTRSRKLKGGFEENDHCDIIYVDIDQIPEDLKEVTRENFLSAIIHPLTIEEFREKYYRQKALLIKCGEVSRYSEIIQEQLHDLDLYDL